MQFSEEMQMNSGQAKKKKKKKKKNKTDGAGEMGTYSANPDEEQFMHEQNQEEMQ